MDKSILVHYALSNKERAVAKTKQYFTAYLLSNLVISTASYMYELPNVNLVVLKLSSG